MGITIIEKVFLYALISTIVIFAIIVAIFLLIHRTIKQSVCPKWAYAVYFPLAFVAMLVLCINLFNIRLDIANKDYIVYEGEYIERGGGQKDLKTMVVYDDQGKKIKLLRTGPSNEGHYEGIVIYGKRSKIVVSYHGTPK